MCGYSITLLLLFLTLKLLHGSISAGAPGMEYCRSTRYRRTGDIMIAVYLAMHDTEAGRCGKMSASQFTLAVGVDYITSLLNGNGSNNESFIPGVQFGYDLFDNCNNEDLTTAMMLDSRYIGGFVKAVECLNDSTVPRTYAGVLVTSSIETTKIILTMLPSNIQAFRPVMSSPDLDLFPNLFKTSSRPDTYAQALFELLKYLKWNYVSLIYTIDAHGKSYRDLIHTKAFKTKICIASEFSLNPLEAADLINKSVDNIIGQLSKTMATASNDSLGVVYVGSSSSVGVLLERVCSKSGGSPLIVSNLQWIFIGDSGFDKAIYDFRNAVFNKKCTESVSRRPLFITISDSALGQIDYVKHFERLVSNTANNDPLSSLITEYKTMHCKTGVCAMNGTRFHSLANSIFTIATMAKRQCIGLSGSCSNLSVNAGKNMTVNYSSIDPNQVPDSLRTSRPISYGNDGYIEYPGSDDEITIYAAEPASPLYVQIGIFGKGSLLMNMTKLRDVGNSTCKSYCPYCTDTTENKFSYIPGDYLLLGLFTIHSSGDNPYTCGTLIHNTNAIISVSAFMEAIKDVNRKYGLKFGGLAIDDCNSPLNISFFLSDFFSKRVVLKDPLTESLINSDTVVAIIGSLSNSVSLTVAEQATMLSIPVISYAASLSDLEDRDRYPYFMRTVPSDTVQVDRLVQLLQKFEITHVGLLYYDIDYERKVIKEFTARAEKVGICVRTPLRISKGDNDDVITRTLTELYRQLTTVVVYFGIPDITIKILNILNGPLSSNEPLVFFVSEASITNDILKNHRSAGFVILATDNRKFIDEGNFARYLVTFNSTATSENIWLPSFWEDAYQCDFPQSFQKIHPAICPSDILNGIHDKKEDALLWEQNTADVIQAVFSVGSVFADVTNGICNGVSYCMQLRKETNSFYSKLLSVRLKTDTNEIYMPFDTEGNGNCTFSIFNIQFAKNSTLQKVKIGYIDVNKVLIDVQSAIFYDRNRKVLKLQSIDKVDCRQIPVCNGKCFTMSSTKLTAPAISTVAPSSVSEKTIETLKLMAILFGVIIGVLIGILLALITCLRRRAICKQNHEELSRSFALHNKGYIYDEPQTLDPDEPISYPRDISDTLDSAGTVQYSDIKPSIQSIQNDYSSNAHLQSGLSSTPTTTLSLVGLLSSDSTPSVTYLSSQDLDIQRNYEAEEELEDNGGDGNNVAFSSHGHDTQEYISDNDQKDRDSTTPSETCNRFSPTAQENQSIISDQTKRVRYTTLGATVDL